MNDIDHIVFDVGRVLLRWDPEQIYLDLIPDEAERHSFLDICAPWNAEQDRGLRSWADAEAELIAQHPEKADWIRAYRRDWLKSTPDFFGETVEIMRGFIKDGLDVTLLTNFNDETWTIALQKYAFLQEPRGATVSAHVKLVKPQVEIYERHVEEFSLTPRHTLFFDDSPANIEAARGAGWQAEIYEGGRGGSALRNIVSRYRLRANGLSG